MKNRFKRLKTLLLVGLMILLQTVVGMPTASADDYCPQCFPCPAWPLCLSWPFPCSNCAPPPDSCLAEKNCPPTGMSFDPSQGNNNETSGSFNVTVSFSNQGSQNFRGKVQVIAKASGSSPATPGEDFQEQVLTADGQAYWEITGGQSENLTGKDFTVHIINDEKFETNTESFVLEAKLINDSTGQIVGMAITKEFGIISDDPEPLISIPSSVSSDEGSNASVKATLSEAAGSTVTVDYYTEDGSATVESGDYETTTGTFTFPEDIIEQIISVPVTLDELYENDENFTVHLTNPVNATISGETTTVTVVNLTELPTISINSTSLEANEGTTAVIYLTLDPVSEEDATVEYTFGGDATAGADYDQTVHTVTILAGETTGEISIPILSDSVYDINDTLTVTLTEPTAAVIGGQPASVTILDQTPPTIDIESVSSVDEGSNAEILITLTIPSEDDNVTVNYETEDNTAVSGEDYESTSGTLSFFAGSSEELIDIPIKPDNLVEGYETFAVNLSSPVHGILGNSTSSVTINDLTVEGQIDDSTVAEEAQELTFDVSLSDSYSPGNVTIDYTIEGVEAEEGSDYSCNGGCTGTLTFEPGETYQPINIEVIDDQRYEVDETLTVTLSNPVNVQLPAEPVAIGTIENHDLEPLVSISNVTVSESEGTATLTVYQSRLSDYDTVMNYHTEAATANQDDFTAVDSNTLTIESGAVQKQIDIAITDDSDTENEEFFLVTLSNIDGAGVSTPFAKVTIEDNDSGGGEPEFVPSVNVRGDSVREFDGRAVGEAEFVLYLNSPMEEDVEVSYQTESGSAGENADYDPVSDSYTFPAGQTEHNITVPLVCSDELEEEEFFYLKLSDSSGNITVTSPKAKAVIEDAEQPCP
ncbi:Calx-beta domain-containing protein [Moorena producens]|uniref:Calx-beta domain-containing protein n=1 Tax=Moorena producens TaxID=1155739 RepID=UPI003C79149D